MGGGGLDLKAWSVEYLGVALPMLGDVTFKIFHGILLIPSVFLFADWAYANNEYQIITFNNTRMCDSWFILGKHRAEKGAISLLCL
jgi:hypothetical protein